LIILQLMFVLKRMDKFWGGMQLFLCLILFNVTVLFSQSISENKNHNVYDDFVGLENTGFYNGPEFKDEYPNASGISRYFNQNAFANSTVEFDGQLYSKVPLEYDIFSDNVLTRSNDYMSNFIVQLIPTHISSFTINGHDFVKLNDSKLSLDGNGFYEVASIGTPFKLYIKHLRKEKERTVDLAVRHILTSENYYLVKYDGNYHIINSIKDFKAVIPGRYKEVQKFRKDYKSIYKSDRNGFMIKLVEYLNGN